MTVAGDGLAAAATLLFKDKSTALVAAAMLAALGNDGATQLVWSLAERLPIVVEGAADKQSVLDELESDELRYTGTDQQLVQVMHLTAATRWGREFETLEQAIVDGLKKAKLTESTEEEAA